MVINIGHRIGDFHGGELGTIFKCMIPDDCHSICDAFVFYCFRDDKIADRFGITTPVAYTRRHQADLKATIILIIQGLPGFAYGREILNGICVHCENHHNGKCK